jgi:hypothetical protein
VCDGASRGIRHAIGCSVVSRRAIGLSIDTSCEGASAQCYLKKSPVPRVPALRVLAVSSVACTHTSRDMPLNVASAACSAVESLFSAASHPRTCTCNGAERAASCRPATSLLRCAVWLDRRGGSTRSSMSRPPQSPGMKKVGGPLLRLAERPPRRRGHRHQHAFGHTHTTQPPLRSSSPPLLPPAEDARRHARSEWHQRQWWWRRCWCWCFQCC